MQCTDSGIVRLTERDLADQKRPAFPLLADDEELTDDKCALNAPVQMDPDEVAAIEERAIAEEEALIT